MRMPLIAPITGAPEPEAEARRVHHELQRRYKR
jgi:hypothetical protein